MTSTVPCRRRSTCRLCGGGRLTEVLSLAPTPPANAFVADPSVHQPRFPLDVFFCEDCAHAQLLDVVDPEILFADYVYVSGTSPVFVTHFGDYARAMIDDYGLSADDLVVDIGSNDGTFLRFFRDAGLNVLGVDPARDIARRATESGIETVTAFFDPTLSDEIRRSHGVARLVSANNVFAHIDDLASVVDGVRRLLSDDGVFTFEVSYLADVYADTLFDTIYHEHLDYHSVKPLVGFFAANGMELIAAHRVPTHGGSLRGVAQPAGGPRAVDSSVADRVAEEARLGLDRAETLRDFGARIDAVRDVLVERLDALKSGGRSIAGFGAPAKATTLMHHFAIGPDVIDFIVDDSPLKQGLFTPGLHIPVLGADVLAERKPDYLLILAWNFARAIMRKHSAFASAGGRFIVPLPDVAVH